MTLYCFLAPLFAIMKQPYIQKGSFMRYLIYAIIVVIDLYAIFLDVPQKQTVHIKAPLLDIAYEEKMALQYLNTLRTNAGMAPYQTSPILKKTADNHATYLIANNATGHYEEEGKKHYTGEMPYQRAIAAGYQVSMLTENVTNNSLNYKDAIDNLFAAIYHRFGFLDFISDEIGIAVAQDPQNTEVNTYVFDMGIHRLNQACSGKSYSGAERYAYKICLDPTHKIREKTLLDILNAKKIASKTIIVYPYDGQTDVPPVFYNETPDPLPDYDVSGFPISIQFNDAHIKQADVRDISLYTPEGEKVKSKVLYDQNDPNKLLKPGQFALLPLTRLKYDTRYKVVLTYAHEGKITQKVWHFHTRKLPEPAFVITQNKQALKIKPHTTYTLYFKPQNRHDVLGDLHFPADVKVNLLDQNTIQLRLDSENTEPFDLTSEDKEIHFKVLSKT